MDRTIPATRATALEELLEINRALGHAATRVDPQLQQKSVRAAYLIGLLEEAASGTRWPEAGASLVHTLGGHP
ncbi:hypothetical protein GCM10022631_10630 [Deinococcus rubellus]|uniref:hypothetical protein n=1 Tax=Deinococcus rubellus TaxID=1889240 RepID=UPI0031F19255